MRTDTYLPCAPLKPYIKAFVVTESTSETTYRVLPNTELVIGFQYKGNLWQVDNYGKIKLNSSGITGLHDRYRLFANSADIGTVLVLFRETGASAFFRGPVHELFRQSISLDSFMLRSQILLVEEQLGEARTDRARVSVIERFLLSRIREPLVDELVLAALSLIYQSKGTIRISELAKQLCTSQSPLEKRFRRLVGTSPKKFSLIVRFRHILQRYGTQQSLTELGYENGFYDQAHFIKVFKGFTVKRPTISSRLTEKNDFLQ